MSETWKVSGHNGLWTEDWQTKAPEHSELLEKVLRTIHKGEDEAYEEYAVGALDAVPLAKRLEEFERALAAAEARATAANTHNLQLQAQLAEAVREREELREHLVGCKAIEDEAITLRDYATRLQAAADRLGDALKNLCGGCYRGIPLVQGYFDGDRWHDNGKDRLRCINSETRRAALAAYAAVKAEGEALGIEVKG